MIIILEKVVLGLVCVVILTLGIEMLFKYVKQKRGK
jgi:cell division protein FtsL